MIGYIHSTESLGTVDGPGIRFVVFFQGCPLRCQYCHNPDTWTTQGGKEYTAEEILDQVDRYRPYLKNGGLTVTGGEPLLQLDFLIELFQKAKQRGIHTCLDTSGATFSRENPEQLEKFELLTKSVDLVMLDIKHIDSQKHKILTGVRNEAILDFAYYLEEKEVPVWIRHVVVPGITFQKEDLVALGRFIGRLKNIKAIDILPYHTMGVNKYKELGIEYPLLDTLPLTQEEVMVARGYVIEGIKEVRNH